MCHSYIIYLVEAVAPDSRVFIELYSIDEDHQLKT